MVCPNKNDIAYKLLSNHFTEGEIYQMFIDRNYQLPTLQEASFAISEKTKKIPQSQNVQFDTKLFNKLQEIRNGVKSEITPLEGERLYNYLSEKYKSELVAENVDASNFYQYINDKQNKSKSLFKRIVEFLQSLFLQQKASDIVSKLRSNIPLDSFTEEGNLAIVGITQNQANAIPIVNSLLFKAITPANYNKLRIFKKIPSNLLFGRNYTDFIDTITAWREQDIQKNINAENKRIPKWATELTKEQYNKREDAWRLSNGLPQVHNTFKYIGVNEKGEDVYDFVNPEFSSSEKEFKKGIDKTNAVMGKFAIKTGEDENGYYIEYSDRWDIDINKGITGKVIEKTQNPFWVKGKIYKAIVFIDGREFGYYTYDINDPGVKDYKAFTESLEQTSLSPGISLEQQIETSFNLRNPDGSRKRFLKKNYNTTLNKVKDLNKNNPAYNFSIIEVMGEKGDNRTYYAIQAELKQGQVSLQPAPQTPRQVETLNKLLDKENSFIRELGVGGTDQIVQHIYNSTVSRLDSESYDDIMINSKADFVFKRNKIIAIGDSLIQKGLLTDERKTKHDVIVERYDAVINNWNVIETLVNAQLELTKGLTYDDDIEDKVKGETWDKESWEIDPKTKVSAKLKLFLSGIKRPNEKALSTAKAKYVEQLMSQGVSEEQAMKRADKKTDADLLEMLDEKEKYNRTWFGEAELIPFNEVYKNVMAELSGKEENVETLVRTLQATYNDNLWAKQVVDKLLKADKQTQMQFAVEVPKRQLDMRYVQLSKKKKKIAGKQVEFYQTYVRRSNQSELAAMLHDDWQNNFIQTELLIAKGEDYIFDNAVVDKLLTKYDEVVANKAFDVDTIREMYEQIGISLSDKTINQLIKRKTPLDEFKYVIDYIIDNNDSAYYEDNVQPLNQTSIKALAKLESRYNPLKSFSPDNFRTQSKQIYAYTAKDFLSDRITELKTSEFRRELKRTWFSQNSELLALLDDNSELAVKFQEAFANIEDLDLQVIKDLQSTVKFGDQRFTRIDEIAQEVAALSFFVNSNTQYKGGSRVARYIFPTFSDKTRGAVVPMIAKKYEYDYANHTISDATVDEVYRRVVMPEIKRVANYFAINGATANFNEYSFGGKFFYFFPELNTLMINGEYLINRIKSQVEELGRDAADIAQFELLEGMDEIIKEAVKQNINNQIQNKLATWQEYEMISDKEVQFDLRYLETTLGRSIDNEAHLTEAVERFAADYKVNDIIAKAEMHFLFIGDPATMAKKSKNFKEINEKLDANDPTLNVDSYIESSYTNIGKRLALEIATGKKLANNKTDSYYQLMMRDPVVHSSTIGYLSFVLDGKVFDTEHYNTLDEASKKKYAKSFPHASNFLDIEGADAQEYTTVSEYFHNLINLGQSNLTQSDVKRAIEIENKANPTSEELDFLRRIIIETTMQAQKPVYSGQMFDKQTSAMRVVYVKSSAFPLSKHFTKDFQLDTLRQVLERLETKHQKNFRASYSTANKLGSVSKPVTVFDSNGNVRNVEEILIDIEEGNVSGAAPFLELNRSNFKIQQENPVKEKGYVKRGTQETKLLWLNILGNAKLRELYKEYLSEYEELYKTGRDELFKELGINPAQPLADQQLDVNALQRLLKQEAKERGYPLQDIKGLDIIGNKFVMPLWLHASSDRYESLLNSIINNRVLNIQMPGNSYILGSAEGFKLKAVEDYPIPVGTVFTSKWTGELTNSHFIVKATGKVIDKPFESYKEDELEFVPAKVLVPPKFKVGDSILNIRDYAIEKDGRFYLDESSIDPEMLKVFGFRIPTSGQMSMASIEIAGFLPENMGDLIIAPRDFTKQMGSDFDVDKLYTYHYDIEEVDGKLQVKQAEGKKTGVNRIIEIHHEVLSTPSTLVQQQILAPLSFDVAKDQADLIALSQGGITSMLDDEYQKFKRIGGAAGKSGCLGYGTKVLMYDGTFKEVQDIEVGDELMGIDSTPRKVLELCRGKEQMYWVHQNKGISYRVNEGHILSTVYTQCALYSKPTVNGKRKVDYTNKLHEKIEEVRNITVSEYLKLNKTQQSKYKGYQAGLIHFFREDLPIDPYYLGLWLAEGHVRDIKSIAATEPEIIDYLTKTYGIHRSHNGTNWIIKDHSKKMTTSFVNLFGLNSSTELKKGEKRIPHCYLANTVDNRLKLLAGLIDGDGYYDQKNKYYEITQKYENIANDIAFLTRSLGFKTIVTKKKTKRFYKNGEAISDYFKVTFIPELPIPVKLERKRYTVKSNFKNRLYTGIKIEKDIVDNYYGFVLDGDHLFILEDFTVTHNTGVYSLAVTFHATLQQIANLGVPVQIVTQQEVDGNFVTVPYNLTISGLTFDGKLGKSKTLSGIRYISDVLAQRQNYSVDNEKEQLMFRLNDNKFTFSFNNFMDEAGFDLVKVKNGEDTVEISLTDFIRTDPSVLEYVKQRNLGKSEEDSIEIVNEKFGQPTETWAEEVSKPDFAQKLFDRSVSSANVFQLFLEGKYYGEQMSKAMNAFNTDSSGLGKSLFDNYDKITKVNELLEGKTFQGINQILNTTVNGIATSYGLFTSEIYNSTFPYYQFEPLFEQIAKAAGKQELTVEDRQEIAKEFKKFIFASHVVQDLIPGTSIESTRYEFFFDSEENESLASYVQRLRKQGALYQPLFNLMEFEVQKNGLPSLIKWNNSSRTESDNRFYYDFLDLFTNQTELPFEYNGKPMTYSRLAEYLTAYAYLEGGIQEGSQFIKYIPVEYLVSKGFAKRLRDINFNDPVSIGYENAFRNQYIQHNPMSVDFKFNNSNIYENISNPNSKSINKLSKFSYDGEVKPDFIRVYNNKADIDNTRVRKKGAVQIYMHLGSETSPELIGQYVRIPVLGIHGMSEYDFDKHGVKKSLVDVYNKDTFYEQSVEATFTMEDKDLLRNYNMHKPTLDASEILQGIVDNSNNSFNKLLASFYLSKDISELTTTWKDFTHNGSYDRATNVVSFGKNAYGYFKQENLIAPLEGNILHEYTHAFTSRTLENIDNLPEEVQVKIRKLNRLMDIAANKVLTAEQKVLLEQVKQKLDDVKAGKQQYTNAELEIYAFVDTHEFVAAIMEKPEFRKKLNIKSGETTLWERVKKVLSELIQALLAMEGLNPNSITAEAIGLIIDVADFQMQDKVTHSAQPVEQNKFSKKNIFTVKPIQSADKKAIIKASIATQYIGFAEGISGSSTALYAIQAGVYANTGNYSNDDVIFVSIGGKRGDVQVRKQQQDRTIKEAIKAIEAGATLITDNKAYVESSDYNEGEKRLAKNLEHKGYIYSEITVDGQLLGVWNSTPQQKIKQVEPQVAESAEEIYSKLSVGESGKVYIDDVDGRKPAVGDNIVAYRTRQNNYLEALINDNAIGNPWNSRGYGQFKTDSVKDSVTQFIAWLTGEAHTDKLQDYRQAIIDKLPALKGKDIVYYTELQEPSHANALDYLINKYDWNQISKLKTQQDSSANNNPADYTNHSGGAIGSDTEWDRIGRRFGVINHNHYREPLNYIDTKGIVAKGSPTLDSKVLQDAGVQPYYISQEDYDEGAKKATQAFRMMYKDSGNKSVRSAYIIRNWMQVKNADAIYAIGTLKQPGENASDKAGEERVAAIPIVKGGTGYAVQMAINESKPVYVYDGTKDSWFTYDYNTKTFVTTDTPTLTKNYAGIGSRSLSTQQVWDKSKQAIEEVYEKTFGKKIETQQKVPVETATNTGVESQIYYEKSSGNYYKFEITGDMVTKGFYSQGNPNSWQAMNMKNAIKKFADISVINPSNYSVYTPIEFTETIPAPPAAGKKIIVPEGSSKDNTPIFETEDSIYLMNDQQQTAYNNIKQFVLDKLKQRGGSLEGTVTFDEPLSSPYSGIIPKDMWDNMIGLVGKGGTGKTTVIRKIIEDVAKEYSGQNKYNFLKVTYAAPTHNAVTMLQESLGIDSEGIEGVKTTAALVYRNQDKTSKRAEKGNPEDELLLLSKQEYEQSLEKGFITPISTTDIIVIDESSMIGKQFIEDLLFRFKSENRGRMPIFIFMGDYRQLPPVQTTHSKDFKEGIISATLFSDNAKDKHFELSTVMRSKDIKMHEIFDSVGNQIKQQRKDYNEGREIQPFDFSIYDAVSNTSSKNILVVNEKQVEAMIDDYTTVLAIKDNPYEMFWVHYNKLSHRNTQALFNRIRTNYFKKLGIDSPPTTAIAGDYVQFKGNLPIGTFAKPEDNISKGTVKPTARFKMLTREPVEFQLSQTALSRYFPGVSIQGEGTVLYNRQDKKRYIIAGKEGSIKIGNYDANTKTIEVSVLSVQGQTITVKIPYRDYKAIESEIKGMTKTLDQMFEPSYIGSSHTVQGASIKKVIVGDYNVRINAPVINMRDMEGSLYTSLTRASEHLIIIKPDAIAIENNQEVFDLGVDKTAEIIPVSQPEIVQPTSEVENVAPPTDEDWSSWPKLGSVDLQPAGLPEIVVDLRKPSKCQ